jgi:hypothetical protein
LKINTFFVSSSKLGQTALPNLAGDFVPKLAHACVIAFESCLEKQGIN